LLPSRSKYWLHSLVRTNNAADDASYNCVMEMEDAEGHRGVKLSKDLMKIAGGVKSVLCSCKVDSCTNLYH
jgi:3-ketoacyl-CoA synthase